MNEERINLFSCMLVALAALGVAAFLIFHPFNTTPTTNGTSPLPLIVGLISP